MSLRLVSLTSCVVLSLAYLTSACGKEESPPAADPPAADPAPVDPASGDPDGPAEPPTAAPTDPTAGAPDAAADPGQPKLSPQEIARFAVVVAEIECTAAKFDDPAAHQEAVQATLARAGLTRETYDAQVMAYLDDPTFEATRERTLEMCKATAADRGGDAPSADSEDDLRAKIRTLAVASECMRKAGATSEEMMPAMLALYAAHGVELEEFSREMARLSATPGFSAEVAAAAAECPEAPPVVAEGDGEPGDGEPGDGEPGDGEGDGDVDGDPAEGDPAEGDPAEGDPVEGDPAEGDPVEGDPEEVVREIPKATMAGTYRGGLPGGGRFTVTLRENGTVRSGSATLNKRSFSLTGRVAPNRALAFAGTSGRDWVRFSGKLVPARGTMTGKFQGVVGSKKAAGGFSAKR